MISLKANGYLYKIRPTSRFSGGFDNCRPSIRSLWLAPLILVVGRPKIKIMKYIPLAISILITSGCVIPCNATRCVNDIGVRYRYPEIIYRQSVVGDGLQWYDCEYSEMRRIVTLGPIYEPGGIIDDRKYIYINDGRAWFSFGPDGILYSEFLNKPKGVDNVNDLGNGLPGQMIDWCGRSRPYISREWYGYPAMGLFAISIPIDVVANVTIIPGILIMKLSP
jgi:hypothetical protein